MDICCWVLGTKVHAIAMVVHQYLVLYTKLLVHSSVKTKGYPFLLGNGSFLLAAIMPPFRCVKSIVIPAIHTVNGINITS